MRPDIAHLSFDAARRFGEKTAVSIIGGRSMSFDDVDRMAGRLAGGLVARGVAAGDRVLLQLPNSWEWIVAYHALARFGAVTVPCSSLLTPAEVTWIAADAGVSVQIISSTRIDSLESRSTIRQTLTEADFASLLDAPWRAPDEIDRDAPFTIGYTSGTTGRPKGAVLSQRAVFTSASMTATVHARHPADCIMSALPFPHVYGNIVMNSSLLAGCHLHVMERFDAHAALAAIGRYKITLFEGVPTMYYQMLADPGVLHADLSTLNRCTVGGQTIPAPAMERIVDRFGCPLLELWGMTEVAGPALSHSPYWPARHGSIGLPFTGMEARIADLEHAGKTAGSGTIGELCVRGPLLMQGYLNNEAATSEVIDSDGWLHTGDLAFQETDGYVFIVDRKKDMIITAGYKIYPAELERVIAAHPAVSMVAVGRILDEAKGELAKAYIVLKSGMTADPAELIDYCRTRLAAYKVPRKVQFVTDLPKTSTGKILRRELAQLDASSGE
jgi:long-chain acyl-CoA synthetase